MKQFIHLLIISMLNILVAGCVGINFSRTEVSFPQLREYFPYTPEKKIKKSVILRFKPSERKTLTYIQYTNFFSQIENSKGIKISSVQTVKQKVRKINEHLFRIKEVTEDKEKRIHIEKLYTMSDRGEIVRFHYGKGHTKSGKLTVSLWKRSPIFPAKPVKVGDTWCFTESIKTNLSSFWITQNTNSPETIHARCTLTGFAKYKNRLCAVIKITLSKNMKRTTETFIKTIKTNTHTYLDQTLFFNIKDGRIEASITRITGYTTGENLNLFDFSKGQVILKYKEIKRSKNQFKKQHPQKQKNAGDK